MTQPNAEKLNKPDAAVHTDGPGTAKTAAEASAATLSDVRNNAEKVAGRTAATVDEAGRSMLGAFQSLTEAYQQIASRNSERLSESLKELGAIKSPADLIQLQQKLVKETFENAFTDSKQIGEITLSVFTTAFEPMKKNFAAAQRAVPQSAPSYR